MKNGKKYKYFSTIFETFLCKIDIPAGPDKRPQAA